MSDYRRGRLSRGDLEAEPLAQFDRWFAEAQQAGFIEANAMTLATADPQGRPSCRVVLLKDHDERGFTFFTNYESRKGRELDGNPLAALLFFWDRLERQVRIEGEVTRTSREESLAYFASRSRGSRLSAAISPQSREVDSRATLEARRSELERRLADSDEVPCPEHWGGYRLVPSRYEFWQGGESRLHDRFVFEREATAWRVTRLGP